MRAWGLAKGLSKNGIGVDIAIHNSFPQEKSKLDGIGLLNWDLDEDFVNLINTYDTVIMSYCMGDPSVFVVDNIKDSVQLVLDVYVPIYVEVSARDTTNMLGEYGNYQQDVARHNKVLKRGDYFICANDVQKVFYTGVLGSLGIINPMSYRQDRIKVVPFGIHDVSATATINPYLELGIKSSDKIVLWFGGLYPWFRVDELLDAVEVLSKKQRDFKFILVGGKNPFNDNPDLLRQYTKAQEYAKKHKILNKSLFLVDWVDYDSRINWYQNADFVISLNQPGDENIFAWRTRVMDYIWGEVVTLTNGGDPLGDELIREDAAFYLNNMDSKTIVQSIENIYKKNSELEDKKRAVISLKNKYYWHNVTKELSEVISSHALPYHKEKEFKINSGLSGLPASDVVNDALKPESRIVGAVKNPRKVIAYARKKGIKKSARLAGHIVKNQLKKRVVTTGDYIFLSHPIDNTGAPLVLLQIIDEFVEKYNPKRIRIITPDIEPEILSKLTAKGVRVEKAALMNYSLTAAQLALKKNDFVFMNTVAIYDNYREVAINMLIHDKISKLHWFIHEDEEQLKVVKPEIESKKEIKKIGSLINKEKLLVYVPSVRVKKFYDRLFNTDRVVSVPLNVNVPAKYRKSRVASEYEKLNFYISGTPSDGRKGQLIALAAFNEFKLRYEAKNPKNYRDYDLHLVSIKDDYVSQQIKSIGISTLGDRLHIYPPVPRDQALDISSKCNVVICCSLNETFALYVAEGMLMGHVVLRNDSAGMEEQLVDGKNGLFISDDIGQFANALEKLLNKSTKNSDLQNMGLYSQSMMNKYTQNTYLKYFSNTD